MLLNKCPSIVCFGHIGFICCTLIEWRHQDERLLEVVENDLIKFPVDAIVEARNKQNDLRALGAIANFRFPLFPRNQNNLYSVPHALGIVRKIVAHSHHDDVEFLIE